MILEMIPRKKKSEVLLEFQQESFYNSLDIEQVFSKETLLENGGKTFYNCKLNGESLRKGIINNFQSFLEFFCLYSTKI